MVSCHQPRVLGYSTVENLIQTAFYHDKFGVEPNCAVYYVGWRISPPGILATLATTCRARSNSLEARRIGVGYVSTSPLFTILARMVSLWADTERPPDIPNGEPQSGNDPGLEALFVRNVRAISAINRDRGIRRFGWDRS